ncbi:MAG: amino acid racemase [Candidatus Melainabacteria bacterium]|nr:amino acid racemase [Candidatus Melainabacteria bacterium]
MTKHIGIAACSAEGAALCYRTICSEAQSIMGRHWHPEVSLHTHPLGRYLEALEGKDGWQGVAQLISDSSVRLANMGADFIICPDNTIHQAFDLATATSPLPWLHIAEVVAAEAKRKGLTKLGVLGTRYLMEGPVYQTKLETVGITSKTPSDSDRNEINRIIFDELVNGIFNDTSRQFMQEVIDGLKRSGCDGVILGCTEIPLLIEQKDSALPVLDSTRLLAEAALLTATK